MFPRLPAVRNADEGELIIGPRLVQSSWLPHVLRRQRIEHLLALEEKLDAKSSFVQKNQMMLGFGQDVGCKCYRQIQLPSMGRRSCHKVIHK